MHSLRPGLWDAGAPQPEGSTPPGYPVPHGPGAQPAPRRVNALTVDDPQVVLMCTMTSFGLFLRCSAATMAASLLLRAPDCCLALVHRIPEHFSDTL